MRTLFRKFFFISLLAGAFLVGAPLARAGASPKLYFFFAVGCPHCAKEEEFLAKLKDARPDVDIISLDIASPTARQVLRELHRQYGFDITGTPRTIIGKTLIRGFLNEETQGRQILSALDDCQAGDCPDIVAPLLAPQERETGDSSPKPQKQEAPSLSEIKLPLVGKLNLKTVSLPVLTVIIALVDGFNPCAMWTLVFLLSLLLSLKSRKRRYLLGSVFIFSSGAVYFLVLSAWLNTFLLLGATRWLQASLGIFALVAGIWCFWDFWANREGGCSAGESGKKRELLGKMARLVKERSLLVATVGISGLAVTVNLVELLCSAGLPAVYTQVLSLANLPAWQYYLYLLFYVFVFMADDILVFLLAMKTMEIVGIESKYGRYCRVVGGVVMLALGVALLFKPDLLLFG